MRIIGFTAATNYPFGSILNKKSTITEISMNIREFGYAYDTLPLCLK